MYGYFSFRPGKIETFYARFDNLRIRNLIAVEPLAVISGNEVIQKPLQILVNNIACNNIVLLSPFELSCTVSQALTLQSVTVINPDGVSTAFYF
jgi:hypothetical protein